MSEEKTFSKLMDRSKLDRLDGEMLALTADLEAQGYHPIDITNALQSTIMIRLKREVFINCDLYWTRMRDHVEAWFSTTGEIASEVQTKLNKERDENLSKKRRNKHGQPLH